MPSKTHSGSLAAPEREPIKGPRTPTPPSPPSGPPISGNGLESPRSNDC
jgi:hypothetical protein